MTQLFTSSNLENSNNKNTKAKKTILFMGAVGKVANSNDSLEKLKLSGQNFGNLLIGSGARRILDGYRLIGRSDLKSPEESLDNCSHIVIAAANWLQKRHDFGYIATFLEKTKLPVTMMGLGAQSNDFSTIPELHPDTLRMMKIISERSHSIGVRGNYTAEVLDHYGIHNVSVVGCPSFYLYEIPWKKLLNKRISRPVRLAVNFTRRNWQTSFNPKKMKAIENWLLSIAIFYNGTFFLQNEVQEMNLLNNIDEESERIKITNYFSNLSGDKVLNFFRTRSCFFYNIPDWSKVIREFDLSCGTRLHGNIAAIINGVPAVIFAHDTRTVEVCDLFDIPYFNLKDNFRVEDLRLEDIIEKADYTKFKSSYQKLYELFILFLKNNGLHEAVIVNQ